jgi:drug/metabolite transporter (DMT)-like permease
VRIQLLACDATLAKSTLAVIVATTLAQFVERIGRRPLWLTSTVGMLGAYCVITALSASFAKTRNSATGIAVIPFLFIFFGFYGEYKLPASCIIERR